MEFCGTSYLLPMVEEEEEEEEVYKLLPANTADHLCQRMARTTGVFICP